MIRLLSLLLLLMPGVVAAAAPAPRVELVVVGPGDDVYTLYGHAAMLVIDDPTASIEAARVFNFGITDFTRPNYVVDFLTGRVKFWGKTTTWGRALGRWVKEDRTVVRYPLNLAPVQARRLVARMERDVRPEHREYVYDTFRENCATRLRDYLDEYTGGAVYAAIGEALTPRSYRHDVRHAYSRQPALLLLTEIVPGVDLDQPRTEWELAYRPEKLGEALGRVTLAGGVPLLAEALVVNRRGAADPREGWPHRGQLFIGIVAALVLVGAVFVRRLSARLRGVVLGVTALGSSVLAVTLVVVGLGSDWPDMQRNWLVLGFVPFDVGLLWTAGRLAITGGEPGPAARWYVLARLITTALLLGLTPIVPQIIGPLPPRALALSISFLYWRCFAQSGPHVLVRRSA